MTTPLLQMRGIEKSFPGTRACKGVDLTVAPGEVHCLLGENGAGKSTLMKILSGSQPADDGEILIDGNPVRLTSPLDGLRSGIAVIYQELDLFADLTVAQNLFMGHAPARAGLVRRMQRRRLAEEMIRRVGGDFSPDDVVGRLPIAQQQLTAIARALTADARVIVMDEPTATLGPREVEGVHRVIRGLVAEGRSVIYISHRLDEVASIGDRVTILRDGANVAEWDVAETTAEQWIDAMIGEKRHELTDVPDRTPKTGEPMLDIRRVTVPGLIDISGIAVRPGEVVGLAGLGGAGRTTLLSALFGATPAKRDVHVEGRELRITRVRDALRAGLALVPESRKTEGLMLGLSVARNAAISAIGSPPWLAPREHGRRRTTPVLRDLGVKHSGPHQEVGQLSGGNQQKVVLAKWLMRDTRILLLDEPTRGLDIGAKGDLYRQVQSLADRGAAVLVASSELGELMANTDRIEVIHAGRNVATFDPRTDSEETIARAVIRGAEQSS